MITGEFEFLPWEWVSLRNLAEGRKNEAPLCFSNALPGLS